MTVDTLTNKQKIRNPLTTLQILAQEIQLLKSRIQPTDTGHIYTTINVLKSRVVELENTLTQEENTWYALNKNI